MLINNKKFCGSKIVFLSFLFKLYDRQTRQSLQPAYGQIIGVIRAQGQTHLFYLAFYEAQSLFGPNSLLLQL